MNETAALLRSLGFPQALADAHFVADFERELDTPQRRLAWVREFVENRLRLSSVAREDTERECPCGCGTFAPSRLNQTYASTTCRKRAERARKREGREGS